jgi:hypothetical protein
MPYACVPCMSVLFLLRPIPDMLPGVLVYGGEYALCVCVLGCAHCDAGACVGRGTTRGLV